MDVGNGFSQSRLEVYHTRFPADVPDWCPAMLMRVLVVCRLVDGGTLIFNRNGSVDSTALVVEPFCFV